MYIKSRDLTCSVVFAHNPIDIAESVGEFVQACGRALRKAWSTTMHYGKTKYEVLIIVPIFVLGKLMNYSPIWFKYIFSLSK